MIVKMKKEKIVKIVDLKVDKVEFKIKVNKVVFQIKVKIQKNK
jgi:hypothetical protein